MHHITYRVIAIWQLAGGVISLASFLDAPGLRSAPWFIAGTAYGLATASLVAGLGLLRRQRWAVRLSLIVQGAQVFAVQGGAWAYQTVLGPHLVLNWTPPLGVALTVGFRAWFALFVNAGAFPAMVSVNLLAGAAFLQLVDPRGEDAPADDTERRQQEASVPEAAG